MNSEDIQYGDDLAKCVATALKNSKPGSLFESHKEYCGHGVVHFDSSYFLLEVQDGDPRPNGENVIKKFEDTDSFICWFSESRPSDFKSRALSREKVEEFCKEYAHLCPYCQQPLRTARAKQCLSCHRDWH